MVEHNLAKVRVCLLYTSPGTRFGITADLLPDTLPQGIEGFHCHCHCESSSFELERTLEQMCIRDRYGSESVHHTIALLVYLQKERRNK